MADDSQHTDDLTRAVSLDTQEIRVALTMTGGVSLAIWMGGVARELSVLMQASRWRRAAATPSADSGGADPAQVAFYRELLDFLDVLVDVDVASGTSAGGINSVLLAYCRANDLDISKLRGTWLELGAMEDLLRDPAEADIPSLMYGDDKLMAGLATALGQLRGNGIRYSAIPKLTVGGDTELDVAVPGTTLYVTATLLDGEPTAFTDDFGTMVRTADHHCVFTFRDDDLLDAGIDGALALAGRSTASFPGAFEPSFLPARQGTPKIGDVAARVPVAAYTGITRAHWAADGGLMNNQPIDLVLERVFDTTAVRPVRRVLLYVVPSTGDAPSDGAATAAPAGGEDVPSTPLTLVQALLKDATSAMSQSIADDLRAIRTHNARVSARIESRAQLARLGAQLRDGARLLDTQTLAAYVDASVGVVAATLTDSVLSAVCEWPDAPPDEWTTALALGSAGEHELTKTIRTAIASTWPTAKLPETFADFASYGQPALDGAKAIALRLARMAYAKTPPDPDAMLGDVATIHSAGRASTRLDGRDFRDELRTTVFAALDAKRTPTEVGAAVAALYLKQQVVAERWERVANAVSNVLATAVPNADGELLALRTYLGGAYASDAVAIGRRLFDLAAAERAMRSADAGPEQAVELIQASADTRSLLTDRASATQKLTGMQFHHFGAFYKRSWRANDWMWGRLDGAGWLVHMLLDPRRLASAAQRDDLDVAGLRGALARIAGADPDPGDQPGGLAKVTSELQSVLGPEAARPVSLPNTALWVASALQKQIAGEELPLLADEVLGRDWSPANSHAWARKVVSNKPGAPLWPLLRDCDVPDETFATDRGAPLMARTLTKAAATTGGALSSATGNLPGLAKAPIISVRTLTLATYRLVRVGSGAVKTTILLGLMALVVGVIMASQSTSLLGLTGLSVAGAGAIMLALGAWQWRRGLLPAVLGLLVTLGLVLVIALGDIRHYLFGKSAKDGGVVGRHIYWLGSSWTHPAEVLLVLVLLLVLLSLTWAHTKSTAVRAKRRSSADRAKRARAK